jgi:hypothetical protein
VARAVSCGFIPEFTAEVQFNEMMQGRLRDPVLRGIMARVDGRQ